MQEPALAQTVSQKKDQSSHGVIVPKKPEIPQDMRTVSLAAADAMD